MQSDVRVDSGRSLMTAPGGRWAAEQLLKAMKAGKPISPSSLRTLDTLSKDEWVFFDEAVVEEAQIRLRGVADLISRGLTINIPNAMGKTMLEYERMADMNEAEVSLGGVARSEDDRVDFSLDALPLPITHKDFNLNLRTLEASRTRGESLDDTQARVSARKVSEKLEQMLFQGGKTFVGKTIYGYTTHPQRNTSVFGTGGTWSGGAKTGEQILADVLAMIAVLHTDRFYGPYGLYLPANIHTKLDGDFKANSDKSVRNRLMEVDGLTSIVTADQLPADNIVLVQLTKDVVAWVNGEPIQTVQWDVEGGFVIKFKVFGIQIPLIRSDATGRSGVFHMVG